MPELEVADEPGGDDAAGADLSREQEGGVAEIDVGDEDDPEFDDGEEEEDEGGGNDSELDGDGAVATAQGSP